MITIDSLSKKYGKHPILNSISFNVSPGDCIGIVGSNGSGKTTLLSIIGGIQKPDTGRILVDGANLSSLSSASSSISYVPQENPLINELTARDNLRLWYHGSRSSLNNELKEGILKMLGVDEFIDKTVSKMSGGMKKRLSIAIALLSKPDVLIMDEPSAALDISCKFQIKKYMQYYTQQMNGSIILASHDQSELSICNKLFLLKNGVLTAINSKVNDEELMDLI